MPLMLNSYSLEYVLIRKQALALCVSYMNRCQAGIHVVFTRKQCFYQKEIVYCEQSLTTCYANFWYSLLV